MTNREILIEGHASKKFAILTASLGLIVFGSVALMIVFGPGNMSFLRNLWAGFFASIGPALFPWLMLDARNRHHILTDTTLIYKTGILSRYEVEIPYTSIQAVTVKQGFLERLFSCGEVKVAAQGVLNPGQFVSSADMNALCIKAIPDYREISDLLRTKLNRPVAPVKVAEPAAEPVNV